MKQAVLLVNLGSPDAPTIPAVRRYLREFLMDSRVLDVNWVVRFCVVHFAILPRRPKHSAEAYGKIWTPAGSPLIVYSRTVQTALQRRLQVPVELAMRYQNPSISAAVTALAAQDVQEVLVIPLFPHYAMSSYESAVERVKEIAGRLAPKMNLKIQPPYFDQRDYIAALTGSAAQYLRTGFDHLLFSFHGLPERHLRKSDTTGRHCLATPDCCEAESPAHATCYRAQCFKTMAAFVREAAVPAGRYSVAFQSRLGRTPWLKPYTDLVLAEMPGRGIKRLMVICPAFVSDCLETIEEIGLRGRETFLEAGGQEFTRIPCLNEHALWLDALEKMVASFLAGASF